MLYNPAQRNGLWDHLGRLFWAASQTAAMTTEQAIYSAAAAVNSANAASPERLAALLESLGDLDARSRETMLRSTFGACAALVEAEAALGMSRHVPLSEALAIVTDAMRAEGLFVSGNAVAVSVAAGTNTGDAVLLAQNRGLEGEPSPTWIPQTVSVAVDGGSARATLHASGEPSGLDWPAGGPKLELAVRTVGMDEGALKNSALEAGTSGAPFADWVTEGAFSTAEPPQDEIRFTATPTGGFFRFTFTNRLGNLSTTLDLPFNAAPSAVADALRSLDRETRDVRISARTTGPGYVIDWPSGRPDIPQPAIVGNLQGASASVVRTRNGTPGAYAGRAAVVVGDGVSQFGLYQRVALPGRGCGVLVARVYHNAAAGTVQIGIFQGPAGGSGTLVGPGGWTNAQNWNLSALSAGQYHVLTVPIVWDGSPTGYVGLRVSSVTNGADVFLSHPQLFQFRGTDRDYPDLLLIEERFGPADGDSWQVTVSNDLSGDLLNWWARAFPSGPLPPRAGSTLIPAAILAP